MNCIKIIFIICFAGILVNANTDDKFKTYSPLTVPRPDFIVKDAILRHQPLDDNIISFSNKDLEPHQWLRAQEGSEQICDQAVLELINSVNSTEKKSIEALTFFDSWGKLESGVLNGNLKWIGLYYECIGANFEDKFDGKYCMSYVGGPPQPASFGLGVPTGITVGTCFPSVCPQQNITQFLYPLAEAGLTVWVSCIEQPTKWEAKDVIGMIVLCFLLVVTVVSTTYDYISQCKDKVGSDFSDKTVLYLPSSATTPQKSGPYHELLVSFSVIRNTKLLFQTTQKPGEINCLHGMRFISMTWVILGHSFLFAIAFSDNLKQICEYFLAHVGFQAVVNGTFSVDSFFFLSGLLVAYLGLREIKKRNGKMNVPLMYLSRYIRLTPAYAFMILMSISIWPKFGDGPIWPSQVSALSTSCEKYWWANLLYINNLYPSSMEEECYGWGWYLANDTQFYLISPLFLILLYLFPIIGVIVTSTFALFSIVITGAFSSITNQQPQLVGMGYLAHYLTSGSLSTSNSTLFGADNGETDEKQYGIYVTDLYTKPWCRIGAYCVGILTGYILYTNNNKVKMPKAAVIVGWAAAAAINSAIIYGLFPTVSQGEFLTNNVAAFYNALSRPMWTVGLAWVTIACVSGYGGPVNAFLSWKVFMPLSRLTYCAYLIHPLVIWWFLGTMETLLHYTYQSIILLFIGSVTLAYLSAFGVSLLIETPVGVIMKVIFKKDKPPTPTSITNKNYNQAVEFENTSVSEEYDA